MPMLIIFYILLIIGLHLLPSGGDVALNRITIGPLRLDYLLHAALFLPWMGLVSIRVDKGRVTWREAGIWLWAGWLLLGFGLAWAAELIHYWLPGRTFNPMDAVSNMVGVGAGGLALSGIILAKKMARSRTGPPGKPLIRENR